MTKHPDSGSLEVIARILLERTGIYFGPDNLRMLGQRVGAVCHELEIPGASELANLIHRHDDAGHVAFARLARAVTVNHTCFFREEEAFHKVLDMADAALRTEREVRIWSAASASGEELYTIAMLLVERYGFEDLARRFRLLGTDLNHLVIHAAEKGVYPEVRASRVPAALRNRYFRPLPDGSMEIDPRLRGVCTFRRMNLISEPYPFQRAFHIVYLRNVLYYFDQATQDRVVMSVRKVLRNRGYLVTSVSESVHSERVQLTRVLPFVYQKFDLWGPEGDERSFAGADGKRGKA